MKYRDVQTLTGSNSLPVQLRQAQAATLATNSLSDCLRLFRSVMRLRRTVTGVKLCLRNDLTYIFSNLGVNFEQMAESAEPWPCIL